MHVLEWSLAVTGRGLALFLGTANVYLTSFALFYFAQRGHAAASLLEVLSGSVRDVSAAVGCAVCFSLVGRVSPLQVPVLAPLAAFDALPVILVGLVI